MTNNSRFRYSRTPKRGNRKRWTCNQRWEKIYLLELKNLLSYHT